MKNTRIIGAICLSLIAGLIWLFWPDKPEPEASKQSTKRGQRLKPRVKTPLEEKRVSTLDDEGVQKPEGMPDEDWQRALRVHTIKKSANRQIDFYGKVVDQHGEPVEGVKLEIKILSYQSSFVDYLRTGREQLENKFTMVTDADGSFVVEGRKGTSFAIERMTKEGYVRPGRGVKYNFVYSNLSSGEKSSMYHTADRSRPVIYKMWKKGKTEPLISTFAKLTIDPKKGINEVYYTFGLKGKSSPQPIPGWDLKVTGKNERSHDRSRPQDDYWEVTLTAGDGCGIVLTDSPHANLAPESGYLKSLTIKSTDQENPRVKRVRRAYFICDRGQKYAACRLDLSFGSIKTGERIYVRLADLRISPNGSRNLEYDKSKRIK